MASPRRSETSIDRGEWVIPRADRIDRPPAVVAAAVMLDVLVAIKMDLTATPLRETDDAYELQNRVARACGTIEMAIRALRRVSDPRAGDSRKSAGPIDIDWNAN
jgi:hypothetical protein